MQTQTNDSDTHRPGVPIGEAEPPLYRSRYGGLWVDRRDAHDILEGRRARGEITDADAEVLAHYIDHGYVVFPKATDESVIDEFLAVFETAWNAPPDGIFLHSKGQYLPMDRKFYDEVSKVGEMHTCFERAGELIFPPAVLRFLNQIYERLALEDVQPLSGEFQFIPGSHHLPELLHYGTDKGHSGDYQEYDRVLKDTLRMCEESGLETKTFMAKKGDVLIWHADLMHGGAPIQDRQQTRKSLVTHFMPLGVMPTFFNCSEVNAIPYVDGGYYLDARWRATPKRRQNEDDRSVAPSAKARPVDLWRGWVPLRVRKRVPSAFATWARRYIPH